MVERAKHPPSPFVARHAGRRMAWFQGKPGGGNRQRNRIDTPPTRRLRRCPLAGRFRHAQPRRRRRPGPGLSRSGLGSRFPWLGGLPAGQPALAVRKTARETSLAWKPGGGAPVWQWFLQENFGGQWKAEILPGSQTNRTFVAGGAAALPQAFALTAVTRVGSLSPPAISNLSAR